MHAGARTATGVWKVATGAELQNALVDGMPHIVITAHLSADDLSPVKGKLDDGIGALKPPPSPSWCVCCAC